jgi:hypothetical protein
MPVSSNKAIVFIAGATWTLIVFGFVPSRALAECGDYVHIRNKSEKSESVHPADSNPYDKPSRTPCRGPNCSNAPSLPQPISGVETVLTDSKESLNHLINDFVRHQESKWYSSNFNARPVHLPRSIFHPPRIS